MFRDSDLEGIESFQRVFTRLLLIHNPHIPYNERCSQVRMEPLWLRRLKLNNKSEHSSVYPNNSILPLKNPNITLNHQIPLPPSISDISLMDNAAV